MSDLCQLWLECDDIRPHWYFSDRLLGPDRPDVSTTPTGITNIGGRASPERRTKCQARTSHRLLRQRGGREIQPLSKVPPQNTGISLHQQAAHAEVNRSSGTLPHPHTRHPRPRGGKPHSRSSTFLPCLHSPPTRWSTPGELLRPPHLLVAPALARIDGRPVMILTMMTWFTPQ